MESEMELRQARIRGSRPRVLRAQVLRAFLAVREGRSPDAVIADPAHDSRFLAACRQFGAAAADVELNHTLYNLRKRGALQGHRTTKRSKAVRLDEYRFASEIAARYLERRHSTTLDRIICDPFLARQFDKLATELAPGFSPFDYRFAALNLRKQRNLKPEIATQLLPAMSVESVRVADLDVDELPTSTGLYLFYYSGEGLLYLGETENVRNRIRKHLDHSDRKRLAHWLWEHGTEDLHVEIHTLPEGTTAAQRRAMERELIRSRRPRFNIQGTGGDD